MKCLAQMAKLELYNLKPKQNMKYECYEQNYDFSTTSSSAK
jgi:hypothetical protein